MRLQIEAPWLVRAFRHWATRLVLLVGSAGPGLALTIAPKMWGDSPIFHQLAHLPTPLWALGVFLLFATVLTLFERARDIGYMLVSVFYFMANVSALFAIFGGEAHSALVFALPVLLWVYLKASVSTSRTADFFNVFEEPEGSH